MNNFGAFVGWLFGSAEGVVTVSGNGSAWNNSGELVISQTSPASVLVEDGATISSSNGIIGATTGTGEVTVTGSGSVWTYAGMLAVGRGAGGGGAGGSLTIADGGQVVNTGLGDSIIGEHAGAEGVVTVAGPAPAGIPALPVRFTLVCREAVPCSSKTRRWSMSADRFRSPINQAPKASCGSMAH